MPGLPRLPGLEFLFMKEAQIERRLVARVKQAGGQCLKWVSPGHAGVPDRIVMLPSGRILFVELKAPGEKPKPLQTYTMGQIRDLGFEVLVIDSYEAIDGLF
jgi:hypothetical protein